MHGSLDTDRSQRGFTLVEVVVVIVILGVLSAILIPRVTPLLRQGDKSSLDTDVKTVDLAVAGFANDRHQGPDGTPEWGAGSGGPRRWYPTEDGMVGDVEMDLATAPVDSNGNLRLMKYLEGPGVGAPADAADVQHSLVWMGLLVNEPASVPSTANQTTGEATPQSGEVGQYLKQFPKSAHADNTAYESGSATDGSYLYVVLHKGIVAAVYESGGTYYIGFDGVYP